MGCITKGQSLDTKDLPRTRYPLPELGKDSYAMLRPLAAQESKAFAERTQQLAAEANGKPADGTNEMYRTLALCVVDDSGAPIFASGEEVASQFNADTANLIGMFEKVLSLSGLDKDREKNSAAPKR